MERQTADLRGDATQMTKSFSTMPKLLVSKIDD